jgi:hypothetical protein
LSTPPAALGVLLLAGGARNGSALVRLALGLVVAATALGTLLLAGVAAARRRPSCPWSPSRSPR